MRQEQNRTTGSKKTWDAYTLFTISQEKLCFQETLLSNRPLPGSTLQVYLNRLGLHLKSSWAGEMLTKNLQMFTIVVSAYWLILKSMQIEKILQQIRGTQKKSG